MNKTLLVEIKDTYSNVTLASYSQGRWAVLMNKQYKFRPVEKDSVIIFDNSWISTMKKDVQELFPIVSLSNVSLLVNTTGSLVKTNKKMFKFELTNTEVKNNIRNELYELDSSLAITGITFNSVEKKPMNMSQTISYTYEIISKKFLEEIKNAFLLENIKIDKVIPVHQAMKKAIKPYVYQNNFIYNVSIEEKFTIINVFKNGDFIDSYKSSTGLDFIYSNIKDKMNISKLEAEKLFKNIGNIPPEAVLDNKIILTRTHDDGRQTVFSKKDLSSYITESVNTIFRGVAANLQDYQQLNPMLLFSGEISILTGFEAYAKVSLDIKSVQIFKTNLIGIGQDTSHTTTGALKQIQKKIKETQINEIQFNREENYWVSPRKLISQFFNKASKYFNYI